MKLSLAIIILLALTGCTTLERQAVIDALREPYPETDYVWDEGNRIGVWKVD